MSDKEPRQPTHSKPTPPPPPPKPPGQNALAAEIARLRAENSWKPIASAPDGEVVETKLDDAHGVRNVQQLRRQGRLWFFPDGSMYVYYTPTHWREIAPEPPET